MKLSIYQKKVLNKLKDGWLIENDGVNPEIRLGNNVEKLKNPTFDVFTRNGLIEVSEMYNRGVEVKVYRLKTTK